MNWTFLQTNVCHAEKTSVACPWHKGRSFKENRSFKNPFLGSGMKSQASQSS
ncbi:hypothetical protein [Methanobrevibacter sp.]|uniref:hypothetical protein n=1 Tax=Methanobrevibacter sp. TaxID=66852 RepID=UPI0025CFA733|nr:hypothetical protein [Methanobrevibacter sp.]